MSIGDFIVVWDVFRVFMWICADHFNNADHKGIEDIKIQVLDYIFLDSKHKKAIKLRLKNESAWIHRFGSSFPDGLNYLE